MQSNSKRRPPKLRQRSNGSLYAYFYDPERSPKKKRVYLGVVLDKDLDEPVEEAPASVVSTFYEEYHDPYLRGAYDPWEPEKKRERVHLSEAIERYVNRGGITENTKRTVETTLKEFRSDYVDGDPMAGNVLVEDVRQYIYRDKLSDSYQKSLYSRLHAAFKWMESEDLIRPQDNPMEDVERPRVRDTTKSFMEPSEWKALVGKIESEYEKKVNLGGRKGIKENELIWILPILKFGTATGMRPSEIKKLRVEDVDFEMGRVHCPPLEGNKGTGRVIPLCPLAEEVAEEAAENQMGTDYLFSGSRSETFCPRRLSRNVKKYITDAKGVRDDHDLYAVTRHTFGSWLAMLGYPTRTIAEVMGHSSTNTTEQYMHVAPSMLDRDIAARFEEFGEKMEEIGFFEPLHQRTGK